MIEIKGNAPDMARRFIDFFSKRHPVDKDMIYVFEDKESIRLHGRNNIGLMYPNDHGPVKIRIAAKITNPKMGVFFFLRAIAHEYRHVLQEYRDKLEYLGTWDSKLEDDANDFAFAEIKAAREAGIVAT